ncbi:hypothetical protein [Paracoccus halophilus]|uniref:hypothetical protein n=1 Tax=Paracoccus halophilus TaxID=376733 RepID=UPI000B30F924|nr:hypothetical protein [Paracoccus halophilus]
MATALLRNLRLFKVMTMKESTMIEPVIDLAERSSRAMTRILARWMAGPAG